MRRGHGGAAVLPVMLLQRRRILLLVVLLLRRLRVCIIACNWEAIARLGFPQYTCVLFPWQVAYSCTTWPIKHQAHRCCRSALPAGRLCDWC